MKDDSINGLRMLNDNFAAVFNRYAAAPSVVGARTSRVMTGRSSGWRGTYGSVLQAARPEIGRLPWKFSENGKNNKRDAYFGIGREATFGDRVFHRDWSAFAASYRLQDAKYSMAGNDCSWEVQQVWFLLEAKVYFGDTQRTQQYHRRRPSYDRKKPEEYFYFLPQHALMAFHW